MYGKRAVGKSNTAWLNIGEKVLKRNDNHNKKNRKRCSANRVKLLRRGEYVGCRIKRAVPAYSISERLGGFS